MVIVKLYRHDEGVRLMTQTRDLDGVLVWSKALEGRRVTDAEAREFIDRQVSYDPDTWVIEIEDDDSDGWFSGEVV